MNDEHGQAPASGPAAAETAAPGRPVSGRLASDRPASAPDPAETARLFRLRPDRAARKRRLEARAAEIYAWCRDGQVHSPHFDDVAGHLGKLYLYLTFDCPLRCPFCYADGGKRKMRSLSAQGFFTIVADAVRLGYESVTFLGGEPLVYAEIDRLLELLDGLEHEKTRFILRTSFGFAVPSEKTELLCRVFDKIVVSIDGAEQRHDANRGAGAFDAATRAAIACAENGGCEMGVAAVMEEEAFDGEDGTFLKEFCRAHRISDLVMQTPVPMGRACPIAGVPAEGRRAEWRNVHHTDVSPLYGCQTGSCLYVEPDGAAYPCYAWCEPWHKLAELSREPLSKAAFHPRQLELLNAGVDTNEKCRSCEVRYLCGGMCRMYCADKHDYDSGDFDCTQRKALILATLEEHGIR